MGWLYYSSKLKTKQDYIDQLNELYSYRSLDGLPFDFGTGEIQNEMLQGSEVSYYEMDIQSLKETIKNWNEHKKFNSMIKYFPIFENRVKGFDYYDFMSINKYGWDCWRYNKDEKKKFQFRRHKYHRFLIGKRKLKKLYKEAHWFHTEDCGTHIKRCYIGGATSYLKKQSNKIVRKSNYELPIKGNEYRKLFDYWWELF